MSLAGSGLAWILLALGAAAVQGPLLQARGRAVALALLSAAGLHWVLGLPWGALGVLAGGLLWILLGLRLTRGLASRRPGAAALAVFLPLLLFWALARQALLPAGLLAFAGSAYVLVKAWTFLKDAQDGRLPGRRPEILAAYLLHLPTFPMGPMHLYGEFEAALKSPRRPGAAEGVDLAYRLLWGLVKVRLLAPLLRPFSLLAFGSLAEVPLASLPLACAAYSLVLYLDFSGFSDVACALSGAVGIPAPENFRATFLAADPAEFWRRWHMSFTRVLTSYVFVPVSRLLQGRLPDAPTAALAASAAFLACGFWHGAESRYLLWGLWHAAGVFATGRLWPRAHSGPGRALGIAATFAFVSLGWALFAIPLAPAPTGGSP